MEGVANKQSAGDILKNVGKQQVRDLAGNVLFSGAEAGLKGLGKVGAAKKSAKVRQEGVDKLNDYFTEATTRFDPVTALWIWGGRGPLLPMQVVQP
jgi:hypothetical protein